MVFGFGKKKKSKAGSVYLLEADFGKGKKKIYTGQTGRSVRTRFGEHIGNVKKHNTNTYTGRAKSVKLLGAVRSTNRFKAEKTIKSMSPTSKRKLASYGAKKYKRKRSWY